MWCRKENILVVIDAYVAVEVADVDIHEIVGLVKVNGARGEVVDIERRVVARTSWEQCSSVGERGVHLRLKERRW